MEERTSEEPPAVVLYDGFCGLCDHLVQFLLARDSKRRLRYAPLTGETAAALFARQPMVRSIVESYSVPGEPATFVLVVGLGTAQERCFTHSSAAVRVWWRLGGWWALAGRLAWCIPKPVRDVGYRFIAGRRYLLFGRREACRVPKPDERAMFLP